MEADAGLNSLELRVDGGATASNLLMQIQADLFNFPITRPKTLETTALGAAYLAGLAVGYWKDIDEIKSQWEIDKKFEPKTDVEKVEVLLKGWHKAINRAKAWAVEN